MLSTSFKLFNFKNFYQPINFLFKSAFIFLISSVLLLTTYGQSNYQVSQGITSPSLSPGTPTGSYSLSGFESVNPFTGKINFSLPLLKIGGRGAAGYTMNLSIQRNWSVLHTIYDPNTYRPSSDTYFIQNTYTPSDGSQEPLIYEVDLTPGIMKGTRVGTNRSLQFCGNNIPCYDETLTRLAFVQSDGSEIEFRDFLYGGKAIRHYDNSTSLSRGTHWVSTDGSNATFIAGANINDLRSKAQGVGEPFYPSGTLYLANGTQYTILDGQVTQIIDVNGNKVTPGKDSLGREITFTYANNPEPNVIRSKSLNFKGTGAAPRIITINYSQLENRLVTGNNLTDLWALFPGVPRPEGIPSFVPYNPEIVSSVVLPDNRKYEFRYNNYGELSEVILPTGGKIEYIWQSSPGLYGSGYAITSPDCCSPPPAGWGFKVYRRVEKRRVYAGSVLETETVFSPATMQSNTITVENYINHNGTLILNNKTKHFYEGTPIPDPSYDPPHPTEDYNWLKGRELKSEIYDNAGNLLRKTENTWEAGTPLPANLTGQINIRIAQTTETLSDANLVSKKTVSFDNFNNQTDVYEYDYGTGAAGALKRRTHTDFVTDPNYTNYTGSHLRSLPTAVKTYGYENGQEFLAAQSEILYDETALTPRTNVFGWTDPQRVQRGNPTTSRSWRHYAGETDAWLETKAKYDVLSNVVETTDAKNNITTISYNDNFGAPDDEARSNTPPSQLNGQLTFALATSATNSLGWVTGYTQFDYFTGQAVNTEDINGIISKMIYNDVLDRPTQSVTAVGTAFEMQSNITYHDGLTERRVEVKSDLNALNDNLLKSESFYDGLGRTVKAIKYESDSNPIVTESIPFVMLQDPETSIWRVGTKGTNPYRPNAGEQPIWTIGLVDSLGRGIKTITPDGAIVKTEYSGNTVTVTDQAGRKRRSVTNALGQLIRVDEPNDAGQLDVGGVPAQPTNYTYDTLNNLTTVSQGVQTRSFVYDSLSRLKSATNPESGTISYNYDNNGNLVQKTDARLVQTTYLYDNLNRVTNRNYSAPANLPNYQTTPNVAYTYDDPTVAFSKGRLTRITTAATAANQLAETKYTAFDLLGRVLSHQQTTDGQTYSSSYVYNLSGALIEETYPSGRVVKNTLDNDGDLQQVQSKKANDTFRNYANSFNYTAAGAVSAMRLGNGRWENTQFNSRLQPIQIGLGSSATNQSLLKLNYDYGSTDNNGNVKSQTITVPMNGANTGFTAIQTYTYDSLNRLKDAKEMIGTAQTWKQTFTFDRYGNRRFDEANTTTLPANCATAVCNPQIDPTTNKLVGYQFDSSGNTKIDASGQSFIYDAENKQVEVRNASNGIVGQYFYDGDGKRIKKIVPNGETTIFIYDAGGKMVAEYSTIVATPTEAKVSYLTNDHLGSPRINTDANGAVIARHDYQPFGEEIARASYGADDVRKKFTSYERDDETDVDFAEARYYNHKLGRFNSIDPIFISGKRLLDPQQIYLYIYVRNNPLKFNDPNGEDVNLANQTEEGRKKALSKITVNMTQAEADNVDARYNEKTKKHEVYIKNASAIDLSKASIGYQNLVDRVNNKDLVLDYTFLSRGESVTIEREGVLSTVTQESLINDAGGFVAPQSDGSFAVVVAEGGVTNGVQGVTRLAGGLGEVGQIPFPDYLVVAHELFAETLKYTPTGSKLGLIPNTVEESEMVVGIENQYRNFHKMNNVRTGGDHGVLQFVVTVEGSAPRNQRKRKK